MKSTKQDSDKSKHTAEGWVEVARTFGEKCQAIQRDSKLSMDDKLEKQKILGKEMAKEIQNDPNLKPEEKKLMEASIKNYMDEWTKMFDLIKKTATDKKSASAKEDTKKKVPKK